MRSGTFFLESLLLRSGTLSAFVDLRFLGSLLLRSGTLSAGLVVDRRFLESLLLLSVRVTQFLHGCKVILDSIVTLIHNFTKLCTLLRAFVGMCGHAWACEVHDSEDYMFGHAWACVGMCGHEWA